MLLFDKTHYNLWLLIYIKLKNLTLLSWGAYVKKYIFFFFIIEQIFDPPLSHEYKLEVEKISISLFILLSESEF